MITLPVHAAGRLRALFLFVWVTALAGLPQLSLLPPESGAAQTGVTVIESPVEESDATPSGQQVLRLLGPSFGPESLDPALSRDLSTAFIIRQVFRGLTRLDRNLNPVPEIAERIEISADGLRYRFYLRGNATFQSGRLIDADDVVFSLTRAANPVTSGGDPTLLGGPTFLSDIAGFDALMAGESDRLSGVTAVDATTVEIELSAPRSTFLMKLASTPASIVDPDDIGTSSEWWRDPNGSGPFGVESWQPDETLVLESYDGFYGGSPALERVEIRLGASTYQPYNLYRGDQIDVVPIGVGGIEQVMSDPEQTDHLTVTPLFSVDYIAFRTDVAPLDDPAVRRALQLAFPRDKVADVSYEGYLDRPEGIVPNGMLGRDWPVEWPAFDLDAARAQIAGSRYGSVENVPKIEIYVSGYATAEAIRDSLEDSLGLDVDVIDVEWSAFMDGLTGQAYPAHELYWGADYPDPESMLLSLFGSGRPDNYVGYSNPDFDALLDAAALEQNVDARADLYARAQQLLIDDAVVIPLYYDVAFTLVKPHVMGLELTPLGILRLESVWLEH